MALCVCVCVCVCVQEDLSVPLLQHDLDGSSGVLLPFYDPDTHMLYIAGKVRLQGVHFLTNPGSTLLTLAIPGSTLLTLANNTWSTLGVL